MFIALAPGFIIITSKNLFFFFWKRFISIQDCYPRCLWLWRRTRCPWTRWCRLRMGRALTRNRLSDSLPVRIRRDDRRNRRRIVQQPEN